MLLIKHGQEYLNFDNETETWTTEILEASFCFNGDFDRLVDLVDETTEYEIKIINDFGVVLYNNFDKKRKIEEFLS